MISSPIRVVHAEEAKALYRTKGTHSRWSEGEEPQSVPRLVQAGAAWAALAAGAQAASLLQRVRRELPHLF